MGYWPTVAMTGNGELGFDSGEVFCKFLTYRLPTVGYWPTVAMTGNGELGFDSGEET